MKKIIISESQYKSLKRRLMEIANNGSGVNVAAETDPSGHVTTDTLTKQAQKNANNGLGDASIVVDQDKLMGEGRSYTKRQIKQARLNRLVSESKSVIRKRDLRNFKK